PLALGFRSRWFGRGARHGDAFGLDLGLVTHPLDAVHNDPVLRLQALLNDLQAIAEPPKVDVPAFGNVLVGDDVNELASLVGADSALGDQQGLVGIAHGDAHAGAHAGVQNSLGVAQLAAHLNRTGAAIDLVVGEINHARVRIALFTFEADHDGDFQIFHRRLGAALSQPFVEMLPV